MFSTLTEKFHSLFEGLSRNKKLTEDNISEAIREVRMALLEADVNYSVATTLVKKIKEGALGTKAIESVTPHQQFIKIVHEELIHLMGQDEVLLELKEKPSVIMLCGLQGSGKTTHCAKLAYHLKKKKHEKILLVACDLQRPAAVDQLHKLGREVGVDVFSIPGEKRALHVAKMACQKGKEEKYDIVVVDTAGRLHIDDELMQELEALRHLINPSEILFVASATMGQDAVKAAAEFDKRLQITGSIVTMLDGDARAGAAISIREVTGKPLKFEGIGEKVQDLQVFNPKSMADRILGMGDVVNLVRKVEENISEEEGKALEKKLKDASFTYQDYLKQMSMMKKMGSFSNVLGMVPGFSSMMKGQDFSGAEKEFKKGEAIVCSMTRKEKEGMDKLSRDRRRRIAKGSGMQEGDVDRFIKGFEQIRELFKGMSNKKKSSEMFQTMKQMQQQMGGKKPWH
ncbi:MAG: signal recognition particle protein [Chlamydiota bacterium]